MEPWDGIWTEELLRDLCGGVTRSKGEIRATSRTHGTVKILRDFRDYTIDHKTFVIDKAVNHLNRHEFVPLNDNGTAWKTKRAKYTPDDCPKCSGEKQIECEMCNGTGYLECDLGHDHDCSDCDGSGHVVCDCSMVRIT